MVECVNPKWTECKFTTPTFNNSVKDKIDCDASNYAVRIQRISNLVDTSTNMNSNSFGVELHETDANPDYDVILALNQKFYSDDISDAQCCELTAAISEINSDVLVDALLYHFDDASFAQDFLFMTVEYIKKVKKYKTPVAVEQKSCAMPGMTRVEAASALDRYMEELRNKLSCTIYQSSSLDGNTDKTVMSKPNLPEGFYQ